MLKESFCSLEKDEKTFYYIKRYLDIIKQGFGEYEVKKLDNTIQKEEIVKHLENNSIEIGTDTANMECIKWSEENSENFRIYLNSIKIAAIVVYDEIKQYGDNDLTFNKFESLADTINNLKFSLINTIFLK